MIIYVVQPGDTLAMIANRFNVTAQKILKYNWVGPEMAVVPGQVIFIPREPKTCGEKGTVDPLSNLKPYIKNEVLYVVQRGDTLAIIARRFDSTIDAIIEANCLAGPSDVIFTGQVLRIPIIGFR